MSNKNPRNHVGPNKRASNKPKPSATSAKPKKTTRANSRSTTKQRSKSVVSGGRGGQKAVSKTVYKDNSSQCIYVTSKRSRCKRAKEKNSEYCAHHSKNAQIAGAIVPKNSNIRSHEYDYYKDQPDEFDSTAAYVSSGVWIGSIDSIHDPQFLSRHGIKSILNTSGMEPNPSILDMYRRLGIDYYTLSKSEYNPRTKKHRVVKFLSDEPFGLRFTPRDFFKYLHEGSKIMHAAKKPIITNCHLGINRSGSTIAAYLMTKPHPLPYEKTVEALEKANARRNLSVLTNKDFKTSLKYYPIFSGSLGGAKKEFDPKQISHYKAYMSRFE